LRSAILKKNDNSVFEQASRREMTARGLAVEPRLILRAQETERGGEDIAEQVLALEPRPTALLLVNALMAPGLYRGMQGAGLLPGRDLGVLGFMDRPQLDYLSPPLSAFSTDLHGLGETLGHAIIARLPHLGCKEREERSVQSLWPMTMALRASHTWSGV
jgi:DNA-binding LacI/PurR family transcriptional regulator